jgi:hypothetical protein
MDETRLRAIDELARRQHGVVTRDQAIEALGVRRYERWRGDGLLIEVQPRVVRLAGSAATTHQEMLAASLSAAGPLSHRTAAWLWGLADRAAVIDVSVRHPRRVQLRPPAVAHRIRDLTDDASLRRQGLLLTNPMRTIVDLGLVEPWWAVDHALGRAISSKLLPLRAVIQLREELARRGRNGTGVVQRVFDERLLRGADDDSTLELRLGWLVLRFTHHDVVRRHRHVADVISSVL